MMEKGWVWSFIKTEGLNQLAHRFQHLRVVKVIDASGKLVLPGLIDDQVHFREPGLTHKAAFRRNQKLRWPVELPLIWNAQCFSPTPSMEKIEEKCAIANEIHLPIMHSSEQVMKTENIKSADASKIAGVKVFMGSSTGNMLVDQENTGKEFSKFPHDYCNSLRGYSHNFSQWRESQTKNWRWCTFSEHGIIDLAKPA